MFDVYSRTKAVCITMSTAMGVILTGGKKEKLKELTLSRSVAALPVGGRYRIIDFVLSNMVHSGIRNVGVITQSNYHSLMDHLGTGKEWDLDRKWDGLFILPPYVTKSNMGWYRGTADALYNNLPYLKKSSQTYVVLHGSNGVYTMDYRPAMAYHVQSDSDITVIYKDVETTSVPSPSPYGILQMEGSRVTGFEEKPYLPKTNHVSMGIYILRRALLIELLQTVPHRQAYDWVRDILIPYAQTGCVTGWGFNGYWQPIHSVQDYYRANMDMLDTLVRYGLFYGAGPVYTKVKDEVPAVYRGAGSAEHSIVADGAVIEGTVHSSLLFRGVRIGPGAVVRHSIVMQQSVIRPGAALSHVILDKEVCIRAHKRLEGQSNYPLVIPKGLEI